MKHHPLQIKKRHFSKENINSFSLGMFLVSGSSIVSECCAVTGIDWMAVDMEASPATRYDLIHIAQSLNGSSIYLFARVAENNKQYIEAALDVGVDGVIIPKISSLEDAISAVTGCYYPPLGKRGLNPIRCSAYFKEMPHYLKNANNFVSCIAQIETQEAITNLEAIASVAGIKGLFIGSGDLALELGTPGNFESSEMNKARKEVLAACKKHHLIPGIFAYNDELAKKYIDEGFIMIGIGNDIKFVQSGIENSLTEIKKNTYSNNTRNYEYSNS